MVWHRTGRNEDNRDSSSEEDRQKAHIHTTVPPGLKREVKEKLKYSSWNLNDLIEEKFKEFLKENHNDEVLYNEMGEYRCSDCSAHFSESAYDRIEDRCPQCGTEKEKFEKVA
jgi:rubrerythrin